MSNLKKIMCLIDYIKHLTKINLEQAEQIKTMATNIPVPAPPNDYYQQKSFEKENIISKLKTENAELKYDNYQLLNQIINSNNEIITKY